MLWPNPDQIINGMSTLQFCKKNALDSFEYFHKLKIKFYFWWLRRNKNADWSKENMFFSTIQQTLVCIDLDKYSNQSGKVNFANFLKISFWKYTALWKIYLELQMTERFANEIERVKRVVKCWNSYLSFAKIPHRY